MLRILFLMTEVSLIVLSIENSTVIALQVGSGVDHIRGVSHVNSQGKMINRHRPNT